VWFDGAVDEPIEIELEEVSRRVPDSPAPGGRSPRRMSVPSPRVLVGSLMAVALFAAGVMIGRAGSEADSDGAEPELPPATTPSTSPPPTGTVTVTIEPENPSSDGLAPETTRGPNTTLPGRRTVTELGRPLLPVQTGLRLVGLTADFDVVEVDLDTGRVSTTRLPELGRFGSGGGYLVVGDTVALVGSWQGASVMLTDGTDEPGLPGLQLAEGAVSAHPGSRPDTFWQVEREWGPWDSSTTLRLVDAAGSPVDDVTVLKGVPELWEVRPDHRGGLVLVASGGTYVHDEAGPRRITTGRVLALGRRHVVTTECDDQLVCADVIIDRDTGSRTEIDLAGPDGRSWLRTGVVNPNVETVSPDGTGVVALRPDDIDKLEIALVDLRTGGSTALGEFQGSDPSAGWSADGRFLLYLDGDKLFYVDRPLGTYKPVSDRLPPLVTFALRP
jgi:hypothetical protein